MNTDRPGPAAALLAILTLAGALVPRESGVVQGVLRSPSFRTEGAVVYLVPLDESGPGPGRVDTTIIDQIGLRFAPQVLPVAVGMTVQFRNSDSILHNVFSPPGPDGDAFDLGLYPRGETRPHTFPTPGPRVILCHVHPEMLAYVIVVPTTLYAVAGADGAFRIAGVPPGRYRLHVWHRRAAPVAQELTVAERGAPLLEIDLIALRR